MTKVYEQLKDLHIRNIVVYGKAADHKLYKEAAYTTQITQAELQEMFKKGMLLICTGENTYELAVKVAANKAQTMGLNSTAVAFVEWTAVAAA